VERRFVQIQLGKIQHKLRAVAPGHEFNLTVHAVSIYDFARFQKSVFHFMLPADSGTAGNTPPIPHMNLK
jgi:hypothetical protein